MSALATTTPTTRRLLGGGAAVALLTASHTLTDALVGMFAALLPTLQERLALTETHLSLLVATLAISSSVTQPLAGALADRFGTRRVAVGGSVLTAVLLSQIAWVPNAAVLFGVLAVGGVGSAAFHPAATSLARDALPDRSRVVVGVFAAGGTVGLALGPVIVLLVGTATTQPACD